MARMAAVRSISPALLSLQGPGDATRGEVIISIVPAPPKLVINKAYLDLKYTDEQLNAMLKAHQTPPILVNKPDFASGYEWTDKEKEEILARGPFPNNPYYELLKRKDMTPEEMAKALTELDKQRDDYDINQRLQIELDQIDKAHEEIVEHYRDHKWKEAVAHPYRVYIPEWFGKPTKRRNFFQRIVDRFRRWVDGD